MMDPTRGGSTLAGSGRSGRPAAPVRVKRVGQQLSGFKEWVGNCQDSGGGSATVRIQGVRQRLPAFKG